MLPVFLIFHKASAIPLNFWKVVLLIKLEKENRQGFLLESEENKIPILRNSYKFPLRKKFPHLSSTKSEAP